MRKQDAALQKDKATLKKLKSEYKVATRKKDKTQEQDLRAQIKKVKADIANDKKAEKKEKASVTVKNKNS